MKILLPDSVPLNPVLPEGVTAITYSVAAPIPAEHLDAEALVIWENNPADVAAAAASMPNLRWAQGLLAGADLLLRSGFADDVILSTGVGLHNKTVAEHAMALLLALVRKFPDTARAQAEHRWAGEMSVGQPLRPDGPITTLYGSKVLIWGFGNIGQQTAQLLAAFGAEVRGVARSAGERAGFEVIADSDVLQALPQVDALVMILPSSPQTIKALGPEQLTALPDHAYLINVGRGVTVDEAALAETLRAGRLGGAGLDVFEVEPLPADSPLWDMPNVLITPHNAGARPIGADELIASNLVALQTGERLRNQVDR